MAIARHATRTGVVMAVTAFSLWGLLPAYLKLVEHIPVMDVMAWRAVFAALGVVLWLALRRQLAATVGQVRTLARPSPIRFWLGPLVTASALGASWLAFIHAVQVDRILDLALGFFIAPLCIALTGWLVLRDRLSSRQWAALAITAAGLAILVWQYDGTPWIPMVIAGCISLYVLVRKIVPLPPLTALLLESMILMPPALLWLAFGEPYGSLGITGAFISGTVIDLILLAGTGVFTVTVMALWLAAAARLHLSTLGILGYIEPSVAFLVGVLAFGEAFDMTRAMVFGLIWIGMILYMIDLAKTPATLKPEGSA